MASSELEILQRGEATFAAMKTLQGTWTWDEMSLGDFGDKLTSARAAGTGEANQKTAYDQQRGLVDGRFDDLEKRKVQGIGMAKYRFRRDPARLALIESVGEYGAGREATLKEADEWIAVWKRVDAAWNPTADNTPAAFEALLADCRTQLTALIGARTDWRRDSVAHNALLAELEDLCVAWYGAATRVFAEGTPEGDLVRGQIPTFAPSTASQPAAPPAPNP